MLVLADSDCLGIDLDQFREGILKSAGDGSRAPLAYIKLRELLCRQLTGAVYGSTGLIDDDILQRFSCLFEKVGDHLLRLS